MENETIFQSYFEPDVSNFEPDVSNEVAVLRKQLAISLKFHHSNTLEKIPIEVAIQVMAEVWNACHRTHESKPFTKR